MNAEATPGTPSIKVDIRQESNFVRKARITVDRSTRFLLVFRCKPDFLVDTLTQYWTEQEKPSVDGFFVWLKVENKLGIYRNWKEFHEEKAKFKNAESGN